MRLAIVDEPARLAQVEPHGQPRSDLFDHVVSLAPGECDHPDHQSLDALIRESAEFETTDVWTDLNLFDNWATSIADAVRVGGERLRIHEREVVRAWVHQELSAALLSKWRPLVDLVERRLAPGDELALVLLPPWLRVVLAGHAESCGRRVIEPTFRPVYAPPAWRRRLRDQLASHPAGRIILGATRLRFRVRSTGREIGRLLRTHQARLRAAARRRRAGRELDAAVTVQSRPVCFYVVCDVCPRLGARAARLLADRGTDVLVVDAQPEPDPSALAPLDFSTVRLPEVGPDRGGWSLGSRLRVSGELPPGLVSRRRDVETLLRSAGPVLERLVARHGWLIERTAASAVVVFDEGLDASCLAAAAREAKIPSVLVAHAGTQPYKRSYGFSLVALYGEDWVEAMRAREQPPVSCELVAVGGCRHDDIADVDQQARRFVRAQLAETEAPLVVFASSWLVNEAHAELKRRALEWLADGLPGDALLVVKLHPLERDTLCAEVLGGHLPAARFRVVDDRVSLYPLLAEAAAVVSLWSDVASEAVLLRTPILLLDNAQVDKLAAARYGLVRRIGSRDELATALRHCLMGATGIPDYEEKRARFVARCLTSDDNRASERLVQNIERLIGKVGPP